MYFNYPRFSHGRTEEIMLQIIKRYDKHLTIFEISQMDTAPYEHSLASFILWP